MPSKRTEKALELSRHDEGMSGTDPHVIQQVSEHLGRYVYVLVDPRDGMPFYVGKGQGVRMLAHGAEAASLGSGLAVADPDDSPERPSVGRKLGRIRAIQEAGAEPRIWILRHGMGPEYTAVEAAAIDLLLSFPIQRLEKGEILHGRLPLDVHEQLTNERRESSRGYGLVPLDLLVAEFGAPPLSSQTPPLLLITLRGWQDGEERLPGGGSRSGNGFKRAWLEPALRARDIRALGASVCCWWKLSEYHIKDAKIAHAVAVHEGVTRGLFGIVPNSWELDQSSRRRGFQVTPVLEGPLFEEVVGPYGHRIPRKARGDQSPVSYWPKGSVEKGPVNA
jgi:uncharacterized protein